MLEVLRSGYSAWQHRRPSKRDQAHALLEVVGYAMGARMTTDLVSNAFGKAVETKRPRLDLLHHSDRGGPILCAGLSGAAAAVRHKRVYESKGKLL